ncbi:MAG: glycosyltransferase [Lachnospiraceae bacterium]|nr:glycosyltransferase [Lachnospiraceae bacterium]
MKKFTKNSSYKIIRITDDENTKLTFETFYHFEKRNFDIINIPDDSELIDIILNNNEVDAIVVQYSDMAKVADLHILDSLPAYYIKRTYIYDHKMNYGIDLALKINRSILSHSIDPTFSIVTPLYNTKIVNFKKAYKSLCDQTINDWEWVLVDDSPEPLDEIKEFIDSQKDVRLKYFRIGPTNGNIGLSKWRGNCMSTGRWLIEFDHDDILFSWCLETIINAMEKYPDNKFIYSDNTTINADDMITTCNYGDNYKFGLGYGHSYFSPLPVNGKTIRTDSSGPVNCACIRHIVGVPNHFRCWERDFYFSIGGHNQSMRIADDYELLVRSFFKTRFTHIRTCCYAQRFDGDNSQFASVEDSDGQGNIADIQRRVRLAAIYYDDRIHDRLTELGLDDSKWIKGDPYVTAHVYQNCRPDEVGEDEYFPFGKYEMPPIPEDYKKIIEENRKTK